MPKTLLPGYLESPPIIRLRFITPDETLHQATWHSTWRPTKRSKEQFQRNLYIYHSLVLGSTTDIRLIGMSYLGSSVTELGSHA
jgi:hypothetical protein